MNLSHEVGQEFVNLQKSKLVFFRFARGVGIHLQVVPGTKVGPGCPAGFATLKTLLVQPEVKAAGVNVFGRPSQKESLILKVKARV